MKSTLFSAFTFLSLSLLSGSFAFYNLYKIFTDCYYDAPGFLTFSGFVCLSCFACIMFVEFLKQYRTEKNNKNK